MGLGYRKKLEVHGQGVRVSASRLLHQSKQNCFFKADT